MFQKLEKGQSADSPDDQESQARPPDGDNESADEKRSEEEVRVTPRMGVARRETKIRNESPNPTSGPGWSCAHGRLVKRLQENRKPGKIPDSKGPDEKRTPGQ